MNKVLKILRTTLCISLAVISLFCIFAPFIYSIMNPELTQMQVFVKYWWVMLIGIITGIPIIGKKCNN